MPKIPAAFTLFIAATLTGCASTVKKPDENKAKQACISEVANKRIYFKFQGEENIKLAMRALFV